MVRLPTIADPPGNVGGPAPITDGPPALIGGNTSTGTYPANTGPGTTAALERALNEYLLSEIQASKSGSAPTLPTPPANGDAQVITTPASPGVSMPLMLTALVSVVGVVSGVAYLIDRRKGKKK